VSTVHGGSLGEALLAYAELLAGPGGRLKSYTAKGWHAQISALTRTSRGYAAADAAGLDVTSRTLTGWLSQSVTPSKSNQEKIHQAYASLAGRFPAALMDAVLSISGLVRTGQDERERGRGRNAPLRVDGSRGDWSKIEEAWDEGRLTAELFEDLYASDVIEADIGGSDGWSFPGNSYSVQGP
jgi:hypothetical protein